MRSNITLLLSLFCALLCMSTTCQKDDIAFKYAFLEEIALSPAQRSYKIGDTLWLEYKNPSKQLYDQNTGQRITADTVSLSFWASLSALYEAPSNPPDGFCDFVSDGAVNVGRFFDAKSTFYTQRFGCNAANNYDFRVGIVFKQKGLYTLFLGDRTDAVIPCATRKTTFPFASIEFRFKVADTNKDIYLSAPANYRSTFFEKFFDKKTCYALRVD